MISFKESGLRPEIVEAVEAMGFQNPTPIQAECIPFLIGSEQDLIANAQTGTGKTAAFGLPILHKIDLTLKHTQALILSPTRELALQISNEMEKFSRNLPQLQIASVYGGASIEPQISALRRGPQIVVGTPGRVLDLINRGVLKVERLGWLVLDEADEMLNMGFKDDLDSILQNAPKNRQTLLFSATIPAEIVRISHNYMSNPNQISVARRNSGADNIEHFVYEVNARDKYEALKRIADINPSIYGIVFCRTRTETKEIADKLIKDGYNADALHGDLSQSQREFVMRRFRLKNLQMLVATDVAARGLDVDDLTHVINYSLPDEAEVYVHRSGRTGRAGKKGVAVSIIHHREHLKMRDIQKVLGKNIQRASVPNGREICEKQLFNLVNVMEQVDLTNTEIDSFMDVIYKKLDWMTKEEVIKRFVATEFNRFLDYYKNARDLNSISDGRNQRQDEREPKGRRTEYSQERADRNSAPRDRERRPNGSFQRFHINLGLKNHLNPASLIGMINRVTPGVQVSIGQIEILKSFSFFEVDKQYSQQIFDGLRSMGYRGEEVIIEMANSKQASEGRSFSKSDSKPGRPESKAPRGEFKSPRSEGKAPRADKKDDKKKVTSKERRAKKQW